VWPAEHRSARLTLAFLEASVDPPPRALDFRRVEARDCLLFMHPALQTLPEELLVVLRGLAVVHVVTSAAIRQRAMAAAAAAVSVIPASPASGPTWPLVRNLLQKFVGRYPGGPKPIQACT
jgi:hypothetical protein